jgi:flagellin
MAQVINTNVASLNTQRNLNVSQNAQATAIQRLSSGLRINSAKDDAAGLAISERFGAQIRGLNQAVRNANDGVSLAQTAEGALGTMGTALQRIRELAVQSANATNSASDRAALQAEVSQLVGEITRVGNTTNFNGLKILDGSYKSQQYQVGANAGETIAVTLNDSRASKLGANVLSATAGTDIASDVAVAAGLVVNGTTIDVTGVAAGDFATLLDRINAKSGTTGVSAQRATKTEVSLAYTAPAAAASITVNGVAVSLASGADADAAVTAINAVSEQTGVTVSNASGTLTFSSSNGGDITLQDDADDNLATVTATASTFVAGIELSTGVGKSITVSGTTATNLGLASNTKQYTVSGLDIGSITGANDAIRAVDFALSQVSSQRATLGALQSRFEAVVGSLQTNAENLSASRSRILDADFASETASLTRAQILQQAGVAMLAQANALPQNVLALLRG